MKQLLALTFLLFCSVVFGQRYVATYQTVSEAYNSNLNNSNTNIFILGRSSANDGGGGLFYYDKNSTTTTNLGTVFGNTYGGRIKRVYPSSYVEAQWFGAKADGTTDATSAIQAAIDTVGYGTVQLNGTNVVSNLVIKKGIVLRGHNKYNTTLKALSGATGWMISFDDSVSGSQLNTEFNMVPTLLENFSMEGNNRASDIGGIYMNHCDYFNIRSVMIWRFQRSALYLNNSVRESIFDDISVRFCGKRDATNNDGAGWPAVSFVDREATTSNAEDKHNGIRLQSSEIVFSLGDALHIDTRQISASGRKVNNFSITDCWIHGWSDAFYTVEFANTLTNSSTLRSYDLVKVGASYDVRFVNNRISFSGQGKPLITLTTSSLGGTAISGQTYAPENVKVVGNFLNSTYSSTTTAGEIGIKADAGSGIIDGNSSQYGNQLNDIQSGFRSMQSRSSTVEGLTFDSGISGSYASGTMQTIGTSPYTIHAKVRFPNSIPAAATALFSVGSSVGTASFPGFAIYLSSNGNLYPVMYGSTISDRIIATIPPQRILENYLGKVVDLTFTRSGSAFKVYINGGEYPYVQETTGTAPSWADSLPSTKWNLGAGVGNPWGGHIHEFRVANFALSASEVMALGNGPSPAQMWGSMTAQSSGLLTVGYKYRITARSSSDFTTVGSANNTVGTEFTATGTGSGLLDASNTVIRLGWIVDPDLSGNSGTTVYDRTTNDGDGSLVGNGVKWIKTVGAAPATTAAVQIDNQDKGYSWDGIQSSSYIGGLSQQLGTDPFTIHVRVRYPSSNPTNSAGIFTLTTANGTIAVYGCGLYIQSDGSLQFLRYGAASGDVRLATVTASQLSSFAGVPVNLTITRSGTNLAMYANGTALTYAEGLAGTAPTWGDTLTTDRYNIGLFLGSQPWVSTISEFRVANRALSATEVAALNRGVGPADVWGSTAILNSGTLTVGKRYRIVARAASDFTTVGSANNTVGTEFVATGTGSGLLDASNTVQRIGWFLDPDLSSGQAGEITDRTSNALDGTVNGAGVVAVGQSVNYNLKTQRVKLSTDVVNNNASANTIATVTGLSFNVTSGRTYRFKFFVNYTSAATTTGSRWSVNGPSASILQYVSRYSLDATSETVNNLQAYDSPASANASSLTAGNYAIVEGVITMSASGVLSLRFASEVSSSAITAKAGSYGEIIDITDL